MTTEPKTQEGDDLTIAYMAGFQRGKDHAAQTLASKEAELVRLRGALDKIARWELPETGEVWPAGNPVSYETVYGSNGARDYMRAVARNALTQPPKEPT